MNGKTLYFLQHSYECGEDSEYEVTHDLGVFETREKAEEALKMYKSLPGFRDYGDECFYISKIKVGRKGWSEGFIKVYY